MDRFIVATCSAPDPRRFNGWAFESLLEKAEFAK
jgi:hypothetical protein